MRRAALIATKKHHAIATNTHSGECHDSIFLNSHGEDYPFAPGMIACCPCHESSECGVRLLYGFSLGRSRRDMAKYPNHAPRGRRTRYARARTQASRRICCDGDCNQSLPGLTFSLLSPSPMGNVADTDAIKVDIDLQLFVISLRAGSLNGSRNEYDSYADWYQHATFYEIDRCSSLLHWSVCLSSGEQLLP